MIAVSPSRLGRVVRGAPVVHGQRFDIPSVAAAGVTKSSTSGWMFGECRMPGESMWPIIKGLRRKQEKPASETSTVSDPIERRSAARHASFPG